MADTQRHTLAIGVVALLEQAVAIDIADVVHRNDHLIMTTFDDTLIVEWRIGARIVDDTKLLQCQ